MIEWNGKPVKKVRKGFERAVEGAGLGRDVTPHVLRHTCAALLMQNGADIWDAAGFLGMTPETLSRVYGHHSPQHQETAHRALARRGRAA